MSFRAVIVCALLLPVPAFATPIVPAKDKAGSLPAYQLLSTDDRKATLEAFTGEAISSDAAFENLDSCVLRQSTEPDARSARLGKTIEGCRQELGLAPAATGQQSASAPR